MQGTPDFSVLFLSFLFGHTVLGDGEACGTGLIFLTRDQSLHWEPAVLLTRPPGKALCVFLQLHVILQFMQNKKFNLKK